MQLNEVTYEAVDEFTSAIKCGALDLIKQLLDQHDHSLVNRVETKSRHPALYFSAIVINHELSYQIMKMLLQRGANPRFKDYIQQTVLFYVCGEGKTKCLDLLVEYGLSLEDEDVYGQTPIYYAAKENRLSMIPEMIRLGAKANHIDRIAQQTPLFYAAREGHFQMCKTLVQFGCNVTQVDAVNKTACFYAKKYGHKQIVQYLLQQYAIIKRENRVHSDRRQDLMSGGQDASKQILRSHQNAQTNVKNNFRLYVCDQRGNPCQITQAGFSNLLEEYPKLQQMLAQPDSIDLSHLQQIKEEDSWRALASKMLSNCWKSKQAHYFQQPVDLSKYCISDYFDIVTQPMDLGTIKKKLFFNVYDSLEQFIYDMKLVFDNCVRYNGAQNLIAKYALQIRAIFESDLRKAGLRL